MKRKPLWLLLIISILPFLLALLCIDDDTIDVFTKGGYPIGSEFFVETSIYSSKEIYVIYHIVEILSLLAMIYFTFKQRGRLFTSYL